MESSLASLSPHTLPPPYLPPAFIGLQVRLDQGPLFRAGDVLVVRRDAAAAAGQWSVVSLDGALALAQLALSRGRYDVTLPSGPRLSVPADQIHIEGTLIGKFRMMD
jgi:hypothetical protein